MTGTSVIEARKQKIVALKKQAHDNLLLAAKCELANVASKILEENPDYAVIKTETAETEVGYEALLVLGVYDKDGNAISYEEVDYPEDYFDQIDPEYYLQLVPNQEFNLVEWASFNPRVF